MRFRKSNAFAIFTALCVGGLSLLFIHAGAERKDRTPMLIEKKKMVEHFGLTDLCLFTDARYTRNPAVADRSSPFQDNPLSLDYFPSGSILPPPSHLRAHALDRKAEKHR
jgi:hypothetical protein